MGIRAFSVRQALRRVAERRCQQERLQVQLQVAERCQQEQRRVRVREQLQEQVPQTCHKRPGQQPESLPKAETFSFGIL